MKQEYYPLNNYITIVEKTNKHRRSKIRIYECDGGLGVFASLANMQQLEALAIKLGFTFNLFEEDIKPNLGKFQYYTMSHRIIDVNFKNMNELPKEAKPIIALSNGEMAQCYYFNDGKTIIFFRPNPNFKDIYKPLSLNERITHIKKYGCY